MSRCMEGVVLNHTAKRVPGRSLSATPDLKLFSGTEAEPTKSGLESVGFQARLVRIKASFHQALKSKGVTSKELAVGLHVSEAKVTDWRAATKTGKRAPLELVAAVLRMVEPHEQKLVEAILEGSAAGRHYLIGRAHAELVAAQAERDRLAQGAA